MGDGRPPRSDAPYVQGTAGSPRTLAWGGIVGPAGFVTAWAVSGAATTGYSPVSGAISELAAAGAPTRALMTAGFVCYGLGVPAYSVALRHALPGRAWIAAATSGIATLGVAAFPLDVSHRIDTIHGFLAGVGYAGIAAAPWLAARPLAARKHHRAAVGSLVLAAVSGSCLAATVLGPAHGLFQRAGLTIGDIWLAVSATAILRGALVPSPR